MLCGTQRNSKLGGKMDLPQMRKLKIRVEEGNIAILTFDVPEKMNALDANCHEDIHDFLDFVESENQIRVAIITGAGEKSFTSGMDVGQFLEEPDPNAPLVVFSANRFKEAADRIENLSKPVIAAINGYCIGGGVEMSMACDIRIASENALFRLPEAGLGIIPGAGGIQRISRMCGVALAKEMALTARKMGAQEAYEKGLVNKVVPLDELMNEAMEWARQMAKQAPLALQFDKLCANIATDTSRETAAVLESLVKHILDGTEDAKEGPKSFFEKRPPEFKGR